MATNPFPPIMEESATAGMDSLQEQPEDTIVGMEGPSVLSEDPEDLDAHEMKNASSAANLVAEEDREGSGDSSDRDLEKGTRKADKKRGLLFFLKGKAAESSRARSPKNDEEHEGTI